MVNKNKTDYLQIKFRHSPTYLKHNSIVEPIAFTKRETNWVMLL